jgi:hypothetical protein
MAEYLSREAVFQVVHGIARGIADRDIEALKAKDMKTLYKIRGAKEILDSVNTDLCYIPVADVQPVNQWISIKESKPKDMQQVLAVVDGDAREAFYNAGCFIGSNFYRSINEVKWWQPLPEPPKDGDTNERS